MPEVAEAQPCRANVIRGGRGELCGLRIEWVVSWGDQSRALCDAHKRMMEKSALGRQGGYSYARV